MTGVIKDISVKRSSTGWETNPPKKKKMYWVYVSDGYVYISLGDYGRVYWVFKNMIRYGLEVPKVRFADRTRVWVNTYGVKFNKEKDYLYAKNEMDKWIT